MSTSTITRSYNVTPRHGPAAGAGNHLSSETLVHSNAPVAQAWQKGLGRHTASMNLFPRSGNVFRTASLSAYDVLSGQFSERYQSITGVKKDSVKLSDYLALYGVPKDIAGRFDAVPRKTISKAQMAHVMTQLEREIPAARRAGNRQFVNGEINSDTRERISMAMDLMSATLEDLKSMNQVFTVHHAGTVDLDLTKPAPAPAPQPWCPR